MSQQSRNGKAFEYACLTAIYNHLSQTTVQKINIVDDEAYQTAKKDFFSLTQVDQNKMNMSATAGVLSLINFEPRLEVPIDQSPLTLLIQKDKSARGAHADVRDVVCLRKENDWEIGISCKHNHEAVKHSRLSPKINFGLEWLGEDCSPEYWEETKPVFDKLQEYKKIPWAEVGNKIDKENDIYVPLLRAFMKELRRICDMDVPSTQKLLTYLLGGKDFYKIIQKDSDKATHLEIFNLSNTLGQRSGKQKPRLKVTPPILPTKLLDLDFKPDPYNIDGKSKTTVIANFNNGWVIHFRIHNASSRVENSMKFDITLKGVPSQLQKHTSLWQDI